MYRKALLAVTTAVLSGAIGDLGQGLGVNPDGTLSPEHTELNLVLSQGTFRLDIADLVKTFVTAAGNATWQHGPKSCSGYMPASGSAPIIADQCNSTGALLSQVIITEGTAAISY